MATDTQTKSPVEELKARREALSDEIEKLIGDREKLHTAFQARAASEDETEHPSEEEVREFNAAHSERRADARAKLDLLAEVDERIEEQRKLSNSRQLAANASVAEGGVEFNVLERVKEPLTYREDNQREHSYWLDLAAMQNMEVRSSPSPRLEGYRERLDRHAKEMEDVLPARWEVRKRATEKEIDRAENEFRSRLGLKPTGLEVSPFERSIAAAADVKRGELESRAPSRIVGQGGYGIPPLWLISEYIPALRPGRVAAGLCRQMALPEGTDSINIPRLLTPTLTGIQTADAAPVVSRDFSDTFQQANVKTVAGQEDVPIQLIEQSPGQILDRVLMTDLIADYNKQVDLQVIQGSGVGAPLSGGQVVGLYPAANWGATSVTFPTTFGGGTVGTAGYVSPQVEFFQCLGVMASKTAYNRFNLQNFQYLLHPRRHFWSVTGIDGYGRFLGSDDGFGPYNATEIEINPAPFEGYAGRTPWGPAVYIDGNVPITDNGGTVGGGTNDIALAAIWDDCWLFEGDLRTRVLTEVLSGTLELRFQVYAYIAFLARYGVSIAIGTSTGTNMGQPYTLNGATTLGAY